MYVSEIDVCGSNARPTDKGGADMDFTVNAMNIHPRRKAAITGELLRRQTDLK